MDKSVLKSGLLFFKSTSFNFLVLLIFWGGMLRKNFNADTITFMVSKHNVLTNIEDGRYVQSLFDYIYEQMGFRTTSFLPLTTLGALCFFAMAMTVLQLIFQEWKRAGIVNSIPFYIGTGLVFLNVLYVELLMFGECCLHFGFGYFCASLGAFLYTKKKWLSSILLLLVAVCTYQYTAIYVAIILAFYTCLKLDFELNFHLIIKEFCAIFFSLFAGLLNFISIKIIAALGIINGFRKSSGIGSLNEKISETASSIMFFLRDSYRILPKLWIPLLFILFLIGLLVFQLVQMNSVKKAVTFIILLLGTVILLYIIPWMNTSLYYPPRMSFCFYLIIGLLIIAISVLLDDCRLRILTFGASGFLIIQLLFAHFIIGDRMISNNLDDIYINQIYEAILDYEENTGITVHNICVIHDIDAPDYYVKDIRFYSNQINERVITLAPVSLLEAVTGLKLEKVSMDEYIYKEHFENKNWDVFKLDEQVVFVDDTIYWCVF